jgi:branched-chain amino acid transport system permease protein
MATRNEPLLRTVSPLTRYMTATNMTIALAIAIALLVSVRYGAFALINSLVTGGMWALLAAGLALVFGVMNIPNFAHGEFFMIGSLTAYFVYTPINDYLFDHPSPLLSVFAPFVGIAVALVVGAVVGFVIEKLIFYQLRKKTRENWVLNSFLLTAGLSVVLINGVQLIWGTDFKGIPRYWDVPPLTILGVNVSVDRIAAFLIALTTIVLFWLFLNRTRVGRALRAVSQDETGAQMLGIDLNFIHALTMSLSCALAALAGASLLFMFPAYPTVGVAPLYVSWYVLILAGLGNVEGAIVGGFIVALLQSLTVYFIGNAWQDVVPTLLIVLILLFKPSGLFGSAVKGVWEQ